MELRFFPINVFRETPKVIFFDAGIDTSNGSDVVIHSGEAISPPDDLKDEQYYVHNHQIDHNLVIRSQPSNWPQFSYYRGKEICFDKSFMGRTSSCDFFK